MQAAVWFFMWSGPVERTRRNRSTAQRSAALGGLAPSLPRSLAPLVCRAVKYTVLAGRPSPATTTTTHHPPRPPPNPSLSLQLAASSVRPPALRTLPAHALRAHGFPSNSLTSSPVAAHAARNPLPRPGQGAAAFLHRRSYADSRIPQEEADEGLDGLARPGLAHLARQRQRAPLPHHEQDAARLRRQQGLNHARVAATAAGPELAGPAAVVPQARRLDEPLVVPAAGLRDPASLPRALPANLAHYP